MRKIVWVIVSLMILSMSLGAEDLKYFKADNGKYGYENASGAVVVEPKYDAAWSFSEGLAVVMLNGKWGYINKSGKIVIEPKYDYTTSFSEGLARVELNGKWGFIDKSGKVVIEPKYDDTNSFSEGLSLVKVNGKYGFIDKSGKFVIEPKFDVALSFSEGLAEVRLDGMVWHINKKGVRVDTSEDKKQNSITLAKKVQEAKEEAELKKDLKNTEIKTPGSYLTFKSNALTCGDGSKKILLKSKYFPKENRDPALNALINIACNYDNAHSTIKVDRLYKSSSKFGDVLKITSDGITVYAFKSDVEIKNLINTNTSKKSNRYITSWGVSGNDGLWQRPAIRLNNGEYIWASVYRSGSCDNLTVGGAGISGNASLCGGSYWSVRGCGGLNNIAGNYSDVVEEIVKQCNR